MKCPLSIKQVNELKEWLKEFIPLGCGISFYPHDSNPWNYLNVDGFVSEKSFKTLQSLKLEVKHE
jgi:hypothetical protein